MMMSNNYQFFLDAKNAKHPFQEDSPTSPTDISSDHKNYDEPTTTQQDDTVSDATNRDTHTLFMKLKEMHSAVPGTRAGRNQGTFPSIGQTSVEDMLSALQNYESKNEAIRPLFQKKPKHWRMQKYPNGIYYGEMINSRRHGKGILIRSNKGSYEGDWENDLKHGEGLEFASNGSIYEGQYRNGKPDGYGIFLWPNGELYEGEWKSGIKHGQGLWKGIKGEFYQGNWKNDRQEGFGTFVWQNGEKYEGEFLNFVKHGKGKEQFSNGDFYEGMYENGKPQGVGEYFWANGSSYKGEFVNGLRHGRGKWKKGSKKVESYDGEWMNDKKAGKGVYTWENRDYYKGHFFDNLKEGQGAMHYADGRVYKGVWHQGRQHGEGMIVIPGQVVLKGTFENNKLIDNKDGKKVSQSFHLGPEVLDLNESHQVADASIIEEASVDQGKGQKYDFKPEMYRVQEFQTDKRTPKSGSRRGKLTPLLRQSVGEKTELFKAPSERLNYSDLMEKTVRQNDQSKELGDLGDYTHTEMIKYANNNNSHHHRPSRPSHENKEARSLSPLKRTHKKAYVASSTEDVDRFEPSGLTHEEVHKWKKMKEKLYSKLHNLDDLSNSLVRQKIRALIGNQHSANWQQTPNNNKKYQQNYS